MNTPNSVPTGYRSALTLDAVRPDPSLLGLAGLLVALAVALFLIARQTHHPGLGRVAVLLLLLGGLACAAAFLLP